MRTRLGVVPDDDSVVRSDAALGVKFVLTYQVMLALMFWNCLRKRGENREELDIDDFRPWNRDEVYSLI